jgi:hypothetical protein
MIIDFQPKVTWAPCFFGLCCDSPVEWEGAEDTFERLEKWREENKDKITIVNIESFDFDFDNFRLQKAWFRVHYELKHPTPTQ